MSLTMNLAGHRLGIDHVDRSTALRGHHLIKDIGELNLELILGDEPDMWCADQIGMRGHWVICPGDRLFIENINGGLAGPAGIKRRLQRPCLDQPGARQAVRAV